MSWRKKKKELRKIKHKAWLIVCLMFAVVIGLISFLTIRIINGYKKPYKSESRVEQLKKVKLNGETGYKPIAWLKVDGTNLDMPIVYTEKRGENFPVQLESFAWTIKKFDKDSTYYDIIGHNIFNLSAHPKLKSDTFDRFEELMSFVYYDFAKNNEYIQLTVGEKDYTYKIFAVGFIDKGTISFFPDNSNPSKSERKHLIEMIEDYNLYKYDVDVNANDKIISLSTCTRFYGANDNIEFFVFGRLLRDNENTSYYKVTKSNNYKKVEKKLKGDE